ncbi:MAG: ATP-binding cassette domain-containing protein [Saprospiraceae bacterium]
MIILENISKSYGNHQVLKDINLSYESGKVYGLVGENGAGKTTLFKCIAGLQEFDGVIKSQYLPLKNHLGFLQTDPYYFSKITGREYIQLLSNARNIPVKDIDEKNIFDLPLDQYASTYSTGMKKKLALMGILLQNNDFFILDEPFNGVDIQSNIIITEIIHQLKALNKTIVISSHIFSTLNDTCDEIHLLKHGQLVKTVMKSDFGLLEQEMKDFSIGNRVERLGLQKTV